MSSGFGYRAADTSTELGAMGLLERAGSLAAVSRVLDRARAGAGSSLFVRSGAGLGKSSLLTEAQRMAAHRFRIGAARGDAMESWFPFGLTGTALRQLGGPDLMNPTDSASTGGDARASRFVAVLRWLQSDRSLPVLLILDDLHWADADSLAMVAFLSRRLADLPVVLLGSLRPWPKHADEMVSALVESGHASIEDLRPLSLDAASGLVKTAVGHPVDDTILEQAHLLCAGNPLLLEQLAGTIIRGDRVLEFPANAAPFSHGLLLARFAGLPERTLRYAEAGSVLGAGFRAEVAAEMVDLDEASAAVAVEALTRSGLVRSAGSSSLEFVHPMFAQVLYQDVAPALRSLLHRRAFHILSRLGLETDAAEHALRGDLVGDRRAIALLESAGRRAFATGAAEVAATHLEAAAQLAGDRPSSRLLLVLGEAQLAAGRVTEASRSLDRLLTRDDVSGQDRGRALSMLAQALYLAGDTEAARSVFQQAVAQLETHDVPAAVDALLHHSFGSSLTEGPRVALALADRALGLAGSLGGTTLRRAEAVQGCIRLWNGDGSALETIAAACRAVEADPIALAADTSSWTGVASMYGNAAALCERFDEANRVLGRGLAAAERSGAATGIVGLGIQKAWTLTRMGRLTEALGLIHASLGFADLVPFIEAFALVGQAYVMQLMGNLVDSEDACRRAEEAALRRHQTNALVQLGEIRGHRALRQGRLPEASAHYLALEEIVDRTGIREPCLGTWGRHAVAAHLGCNQEAEARRVVDWLKSCASVLPCIWPQVAAATGEALFAQHHGDNRAAEAAFKGALSLHQASIQPVEEAETLVQYGAFLRRTGQRVRARPLLARALELAEGSGAYWVAGFVQAELTAAGGRRRKQLPPDLLTAQESRVAELAAAGLSNREMSAQLSLSNATVETHLQRIYSKLAIHSRRELMLKAHSTRGFNE